MTTAARPRAGRGVDRGLTILLAFALLVPVLAVAGILAGYRLMIIQTGSMTPTLSPGDLVVSKYEPATRIHPGQIVTFVHPGLHAKVTHRVLSVHVGSASVRVTTKGDANSVGETWRIPTNARVGREVFRIPGLSPQTETNIVRTLVWTMVIAGLGFIASLLRKVWRSPADESELVTQPHRRRPAVRVVDDPAHRRGP